jgi:predicted transcriptional regulator
VLTWTVDHYYNQMHPVTLRDDLHRLIDELSDACLGDASILLDAVLAQESAGQVLARARDAEVDAWQRTMIREAVVYADGPNAKWVAHEDMAAWLRSWGTEHQLPPPAAKHKR